MRRFLSLVVLLSLLTGGCGKINRFPWPKPAPAPTETDREKEQAEAIEKKKKNIKKITEYELKIEQLYSQLWQKRGAGYNTTEAEKALKSVQNKLDALKDLNYWAETEGQFKAIQEQFQELDGDLRVIKNLIKKSLPFDGQPIKKEKKTRRYMDDRDWVVELAGEPDPLRVHERPIFSLDLYVYNPSAALQNTDCWQQNRGSYHLYSPPKVVIWEYPPTGGQGAKQYVFMETNSVVEQFMMRNQMTDDERDELLIRLCQIQTYSGYRLIYVGDPVTDVYQIFDQVFTGRGRLADMFGVGALERLAKAQAVLPDLTIAALAFDTEIFELNQKHKERSEHLSAVIQTALDQILAGQRTINIGKTKIPPTPARQAQKVKEEAGKVFQGGNIDKLIKLLPDKEEELQTAGQEYKVIVQSLQKAFQQIRKDLLHFRTDFGEGIVFFSNQHISIWILAQGVKFQEKTQDDVRRLEEPDLTAKVEVKVRWDKNEEPVLVQETPEIKIAAANRYISEMKDYQRLTSFGLVFPFLLPPGYYEATLTITDNLRGQTTQIQVNWMVYPSQNL